MGDDAMIAAIASAETKLERLDATKQELEEAIRLKKAQIANLKDVITTLQSSDSCLVPLSPTGEGAWKIPGWQFVDKGRTTSIPVVYPANDTTRNRLKQILERAKRQILDRPIGIERHFVQLSAR